MKKTWIIIKREYLTRVKKKSFLITTIVLPIGLSLLTALMLYITINSDRKEHIAVFDESKLFENKLDTTSKTYSFSYLQKIPSGDLKSFFEKNKTDILVHVYPATTSVIPDSVKMLTENSISVSAEMFINDALNNVIKNKLLQEAGINQQELDSIKALNIKSITRNLDNKETNSAIYASIGYVSGFIIYIVILLYGMGVMRGVMEEKTNRIAEVMISSVSPFQLMMGKIVGIGFVGLTQFILWLLLGGILNLILPFFIPGFSESMMQNIPSSELAKLPQTNSNEIVEMYKSVIESVNWVAVIFGFLFYFLGGYFLYAALFSAVGSLVNEDPQEAQQMTLPVTLPIIFGFFIMMQTVQDPNSNLAIFGSIFPLTSPIVMLGRIPYGVPWQQLLASVVCLILGFLFFTWLSAKIYRTGILMYGKKASWKELWKWIKMN